VTRIQIHAPKKSPEAIRKFSENQFPPSNCQRYVHFLAPCKPSPLRQYGQFVRTCKKISDF